MGLGGAVEAERLSHPAECVSDRCIHLLKARSGLSAFRSPAAGSSSRDTVNIMSDSLS